ncbi:hypothetical protein CFC21_062553, partial [Triticum aestivum]
APRGGRRGGRRGARGGVAAARGLPAARVRRPRGGALSRAAQTDLVGALPSPLRPRRDEPLLQAPRAHPSVGARRRRGPRS